MRQRHIAVISIPASGHCVPIYGIVAELIGLGHRVSFASGTGHVEIPRSLGAHVVTYRTNLSASRVYNADTQQELEQMPLFFLQETMLVLPQLEEAFSADPPDLIVFDVMAWAGWMLAEKWKIPAMQTWPVFASNTEFSLDDTYTVFDLQHPAMVEFNSALGTFLRQEGFDSMTNSQFFNYSAERHLVLFPRSFQFAGDTFDDSFRFVGPCGLPSQERRTSRSLRTGPTRVLVSLGTAYNDRPDFYRKCLAALPSPDWNVTMTVGHRIDLGDLGDIPDNVRVEAYIPHTELFGDIDVFVCQAGMGAMIEALAMKIPLVLLPQSPEQKATADRAVQLHLGVRLSEGCSPAEIAAAVGFVMTDRGIGASVAQFSAEIAECGGAARAAAEIERFIVERGDAVTSEHLRDDQEAADDMS